MKRGTKKVLFSVFLCLIVIFTATIFFFKGPLMIKPQAVYLAYLHLLELDYIEDFQEFCDHDFKAVREPGGIWLVMNRQFYDLGTGLLDGQLLFKFDRNRNCLNDQITTEELERIFKKYVE